MPPILPSFQSSNLKACQVISETCWRVAEFLVHSARRFGKEVKTTHQEIAMELGTAREVVSRILKDFEQENLISLSR